MKITLNQIELTSIGIVLTLEDQLIFNINFVKKLLRYVAVGLLVAILYFSFYYLFLYFLIIPRLLANTSAYLIAVIVQYKLQSNITFKDSAHSRKRLIKFSITVFLGYCFSMVTMGILVPHGYVSEFLGLIIVVFILPISNLFLMFLWVFISNAVNQASIIDW